MANPNVPTSGHKSGVLSLVGTFSGKTRPRAGHVENGSWTTSLVARGRPEGDGPPGAPPESNRSDRLSRRDGPAGKTAEIWSGEHEAGCSFRWRSRSLRGGGIQQRPGGDPDRAAGAPRVRVAR